MIGGSAGIGLETARRARAEGADIILTGRNPDRLERAAAELGALSSTAFDATDPGALDRICGWPLPSRSTPSAGYDPAVRCCSWAAPAAADEDPSGRGPAVHSPSEYREFDGIMVPTRRRVCVRNPYGTPALRSVSIPSDVTNAAFG